VGNGNKKDRRQVYHGVDVGEGWPSESYEQLACLTSSSPVACRSVFQTICCLKGINLGLRSSYYVDLSGANLQLDSFEELAIPLFDQLYNFAHWLTQNRDEAEDLVQETYVKALKGFPSFQLGTNFRAWIYRILRNTFLTSRKGLKVTMTVPLDFDEDEEGPEPAIEHDTPETLLLTRSSREVLQSAIDKLPVHFREILLLCEVEEMSYQEISDMLAVPIGTVMSRLSRARQTLRNQLRPHVQQGTGLQIARETNHGL
jgi:RNA polymerase sigma-70 factor (ECF subfamily)